jgi:YVTN family beta-propeller protein
MMSARAIGIALLGGVAAFLAYAIVQNRIQAAYGSGVFPPDDPSEVRREIAFVADAVGATVTLIDIEARESLGRIDIAPDGRRVGLFRDPVQALIGQRIMDGNGINHAQDTDLSPDGRVLYVARGHLGDVVAVDLAASEIIWRTPVGGFRADHMTLSADGAQLYVSALISRRVDVIDARTGRITGRIPTGDFPHDNHLSADGARLYNAALGDMTKPEAERAAADRTGVGYPVTITDAASGEVIARHEFPAGVRPFAVTEDETRLYAQLSNTHAVIAYDLQRGEIIDRLDLPEAEGISEEDWDFEAPHHGLALSPDESLLCLAGRASDYAGLVAADGLALIATVPTGDAPSWSAITADGALCLTANTRSDDVSIIDLEARGEVARLPAGRGPKHITIGQVPVSVLAALSGD